MGFACSGGKDGGKTAAVRAFARGIVFHKGRTTRMLFEILRRRTLRAVSLACICAGVGLSAADGQTLGSSDIQSILQGVQQPAPAAPPQAPTPQIPTPPPQTLTPPPTPTPAPPASTAPSGLETQ